MTARQGGRFKRRIESYIQQWKKRGYQQDIPDEAPARLEELNKVASYRMICLTIMRNDFQCETLGFSRRPCEMYMALKKIEIEAREKGKAKDGKRKR